MERFGHAFLPANRGYDTVFALPIAGASDAPGRSSPRSVASYGDTGHIIIACARDLLGTGQP